MNTSQLSPAAPRLRLCTLTVYTLAITCATVSGQTARQAEAVRGTPKIDGKLDEVWGSAPQMVVRTPVPTATSINAVTAAWAQTRVLWDDNRIYVFFDVHDKNISAIHGEPWQRDSVEVFIDENHGKTTTYQPDDGQYRVTAAGQRSGGPDVSSIEAAVRRRPRGYLVEMAIPFRTVKPRAGMTIGFDAQVNDDPGVGGRRAIMKWSDPTDRSWQDTSRFGHLTLRRDATIADQRVSEPGFTPSLTASESSSAELAPKWTDQQLRETVPDWVADAIFYQIFPERFRNGDPGNDPTHASLEFPDVVPRSWTISPWTGDWYARAPWETQMGANFYEDGVFHRRYGGDLQGVLDKLDYLQELGINTIYFNPVFYARSLHKYDGNSFHHVDPYFGPDPQGDLALISAERIAAESGNPDKWVWTAADKLFLKLIDEAHRRQMRIIIDGVFNHTGRDFFAFADIRQKQQQSPYRDWYIVQKFDDPDTEQSEFQYKGWWGVDTLPEFADNQDGTDLHPGPKAYVFAATRRWMDPDGDGDPQDGIDGWRLDVANEVPIKFWQDWNRLVRELNPQAYTVTELWQNASTFLRTGGFSATMNYHGFAFLVKGWLINGTLPPSRFAADFQSRQTGYPEPIRLAMQNLIDSHDTDRLASMIVNGKRPYLEPDRFDYDVGARVSPRHDPEYDVHKPTAQQRQIQRLVALFQLTCVGAPMIYYGTEAGMWGADDPDDRMPMVWPDLTYDDATQDPRQRLRRRDTVAFDRSLFRFYQDAIRLRKESVPLRRGGFQVVATDDTNRTLAFVRQVAKEWALVAVNRHQQPQVVTLPRDQLPTENQEKLRCVFSSQSNIHDDVIELTNTHVRLRLPPLTGIVFCPRLTGRTGAVRPAVDLREP